MADSPSSINICMTLVMLYEAYLFNCQNDDVEVVYVNAHCAKLDTLQRKQLKVLQISCRYNGSRKVSHLIILALWLNGNYIKLEVSYLGK